MDDDGSSHMSRREFCRLVTTGSVGLAIASECAAESQAPTTRRPNILLLMTDQHRADCIGADGNSIIKTPSYDRIAREGALFTHAYSSTPTCTPARAALLTGLSPWHHGMIGFGRIAERYPFEMPRALNDAGYYTFVSGKCHYFPQRNYHGFQGALLDESGRVWTPDFISDYRKWFKEKAPNLDPDATGIGWNDYRSGVYKLPEELHPTRWTGDRAVEFIEKYDRDEPFMLKVSFARPHSPYDPPKRFWDMYRDEDMPAPSVGKWAAKYAPGDPKNYTSWHGDFGVAQAKRSRRGYYGSVTFIDEQVGRILKALEKKGELENTLIVTTVDHGDMLGDHHHWRKSYPYEGSARIPMLIRWPKCMGISAKRGVKLDQPVEIRDILPTFLDAAGAPIPKNLDGMSMLDLVRGKTDGWREYIDLEHGFCYAPENTWHALTDGRWKYIYYAFDGTQQLFDLKSDPGELNDLAQDPSCARALKSWRRRLVKHLSERGEPFVVNGDLGIRKKKQIYSPLFPGKQEDVQT